MNEDTGTELNFRIHHKDGQITNIVQRIDLKHTIRELKELILNLTENEPFFLEHFMVNYRSAKDLVNKIHETSPPHGNDLCTMNVYLDRDSFGLSINPTQEGLTNPVGFKGLTPGTTIG